MTDVKEPSGVKKIADEKGLITAKFIRPVLKLSTKEVKDFCMEKVDGMNIKKFNPLRFDILSQDENNFYQPGKVYKIPLELAKRLIRMGIPVRHIDNSKAKKIEEVIGVADSNDPRIREEYPVIEVSESDKKKLKKGKKSTEETVDKTPKTISNSPLTAELDPSRMQAILS